ncbi:hypothetical protein BQ8794_140109 [Mesorhizobium prunaredense]|uniref:Uncharacterized protein n=1 Tax=Mesorhizobium prunaredense TaxID=1631249 RepID=A0A1R3V242_9HYPH|nr:hypothetical protein BQ8794_140109 [Mesorhizobium prunaredense]
MPAYMARCALGRLAESFQDKANLRAQAIFGVFAVLNAVLDQNRVEERRERGVDRTRRFCRVLDLEFARLGPLANDRLKDRHHSLDMRLDDRPVLLHGGDDHVVHAPFRELTLSTLREKGAHLRGARVRD